CLPQKCETPCLTRGMCKLCDIIGMPTPVARNGNTPQPSSNGGAIMPSGGNDWLALTPEPTLEPELPICDPHHRLWQFRPEPLPYQHYLLPELAEDLNSGHNVRATVFIEVKAQYRADGPEAMRPVGEVEFVEGLATKSASGKYGRARVAAA